MTTTQRELLLAGVAFLVGMLVTFSIVQAPEIENSLSNSEQPEETTMVVDTVSSTEDMLPEEPPCVQGEGEPTVITSITPAIAPVGTPITITGCNLTAYHGDNTTWFERVSDGERGVLQADLFKNYAEVSFSLPGLLCHEVTTYSGNPCSGHMQLDAGIYNVTVMGWEGESDPVTFEVIELTK
jgi:hypothetical protein